ncbi:hypothetical protein AB4298_04325 [Shewanella sp. 10N.261.52.F9]|uniref:hypothetical protein n=1 Tax=Shewanella TaxID=22 RepID=UPI00200D50DC|nr:hypothetical protein [Shewanella marinintestina]MCL1146961.1 hypothetical protein [Shewanella marinintestina]
MNDFSISRLNTSLGIVKLKGTSSLNEQTNQHRITVSQLEIMGSDGWVELDIYHPNSQKMIKQLEAEVTAHLSI